MLDEKEKRYIPCDDIKAFHCGPSRFKQERPLWTVVSVVDVNKKEVDMVHYLLIKRTSIIIGLGDK
jgi:hypothetical protein